MTLIALLIAFGLELSFPRLQELRSLDWWSRYSLWLRGVLGDKLGTGPLGLLILLLGPVLVVGLLQSLLADVWLGLFSLLFAIAVQAYCLHYQPLDTQVDRFADAAESGEDEQARDAAGALLGRPVSEQDPNRDMAEGVLLQSTERLFSVIFWFALLGPLGAVLYRLTWHLGRNAETEADALEEAAFRLQAILDWIPARLAALGYALAGSFEDAVHEWRNVDQTSMPDDFASKTQAVQRQAGMGAIQAERYEAGGGGEYGDVRLDTPAVKAARGLVLRTLVIWAIGIALLTLAGWTY